MLLFFSAAINAPNCGTNKFNNKIPERSYTQSRITAKLYRNLPKADAILRKVLNGRNAKEGEVPWIVFIYNEAHHTVS